MYLHSTFMYTNDNGVISHESHVTYAAMLIQHRKESPETNNVKSERVGTMYCLKMRKIEIVVIMFFIFSFRYRKINLWT